MFEHSPYRNLNIRVDGLEGQASALRLEEILGAVPGVASAHVNFATGIVSVCPAGAGFRIGKLVEMIEGQGLNPIGELATFRVEGLDTPQDAARISRSLKGAFGIMDLQIDYHSHQVSVEYLDPPLNPLRLVRHIKSAGEKYQVLPLRLDPLPHRSWDIEWDRPERRVKRRLWASLFLTLLFSILLGLHLTTGLQTHYYRWSQFVLATVLVFGPFLPVFTNTLRSIRLGCFDGNILTFMGVMVLYLYSAIRTFLPQVFSPGYYVADMSFFFDIAVIVTLVHLGRFYVARARRKTARELSQMQDFIPLKARVVWKDEQQICDTACLTVGDRVQVRAEERIPTDGTVIEGNAVVDESDVTAEQFSVAKGRGDTVMAGTLVTEGVLEYWTTQVGRHTTIAQILRLVREAQGTRAPLQWIIDRFAQILIPFVMMIAVMTFVFWYGWGSGPVLTHALLSAVSVLLVVSPLMLALAIPAGLLAGTAMGARMGILFRGGPLLSLVNRVDTVVLDLQGTLTKERSEVVEIVAGEKEDPREILLLAASALADTEHPVAHAVIAAARQDNKRSALLPIERREGRYGYHVTAALEGRGVVTVGGAELFEEKGISVNAFVEKARALRREGREVLYVAREDETNKDKSEAKEALGLIAVGYTLRGEAAEAVEELKRRRFSIILMGEEHPETVRAVSEKLDIARVEGGITGPEMAGFIHRLQKEGRTVLFVSRGTDRFRRGALDRADVGMVVGSGSEVGERMGDITLIGSDPRRFAEALDLCRLTTRTARNNLLMAFIYNLFMIPLAAGAFQPVVNIAVAYKGFSPILASFISVGAGAVVIVNSTRLKRRFRCAACRVPSDHPCRHCPKLNTRPI